MRRALFLATTAIVLVLAIPAAASASQTLTVEKAGTGMGTVKSSPVGIECGATCAFAFADDTAVTLTGTAGVNTAPVAWSGCDSETIEHKCKVTMSAAKAVTATFIAKLELKVAKKGTGTGTVTSSPAGISCGATCSANFGEGSTITLTGAPGPNTKPVQWSGCDSVNGEDKCLVAMSAVRSVTAVFNIEGPQLTVTKAGTGTGTVTSSPAGLECGTTCAVNFVKGAKVTLTGIPDPHSEAANWSGCDTVNGEGKCVVEMSAARQVTATFKPQPGFALYTVSVERTGTGKGTVTSSPAGISCGATCSTEVVAKTTITLTALPAEGSVFDHWSGGGCTGVGTCEKSITTTRTVKAVFTAVGTRTLVIVIGGSGSVKSKAAGIDCSASCSPQVAAGKKITLSAKAASGSTFSGWSGACSGTKACKVQMSEAQSVTATFAKVAVPRSTGVATVASKAKVKGGKAYVRVSCAGPSSCRGSLKLLARLKGKKSVAIGTATFSLAPGSSTTLKVRLSAKARKALKGTGELKARVSGVGFSPHAVALKA